MAEALKHVKILKAIEHEFNDRCEIEHQNQVMVKY